MTLYSVQPKETVSMLTRDGVRLDADLYRPDATGEFPVLLMRQPYGRAIASTVVYAHPAWYAAHGYIVVIQDVRGRGSSEGQFDLFAHEIEDGYDSVLWAASLPHSTGQVGMYGFSYQGMTQLYAAAAQPAALKTICPAMVAYDLYADWAYEGGAFCYQLNLGWAIQLATETARRQHHAQVYQTLYAASRNPPLADAVCAQSPLLAQFAPESFYHAWLNHPQGNEPYWARLSPQNHLQSVDLPMLHIGGWFDTHLRGTLRLYQAMVERSPSPHHLWIGPWGHLPWGRRVGAMDYGPEACSPIDRLQVRWFDQILKGIHTGILDQPSVSLFELGSHQWRTFETFPQGPVHTWNLGSTGLAAMGDREGFLSPNASPPERAIDLLVHDPWRPVPAVGGHATLPAGPLERSAIDSRTDVLTYTSPPLEADLHLVGQVIVAIACTADAPSFDLSAVLSDVQPDGSVYPFSHGYQRQTTTDSAAIHLALQPTCIRIPRGHALRLSLSAACFPAYPVNPGTGDPPHAAQLIQAKVITLQVHTGAGSGSHLQLPIASP